MLEEKQLVAKNERLWTDLHDIYRIRTATAGFDSLFNLGFCTNITLNVYLVRISFFFKISARANCKCSKG